MRYILINLKVLVIAFGLLYTSSAFALLVELQLDGKITGIKTVFNPFFLKR